MPDTTPDQPLSMGKEPEIHVIPEQFYGVAGKVKLKPAKETKAEKPSKTPAPAVPGQPAEAGQKIEKPKPASKKWILIPLLALLFVGGLGIGTWFLLKPPAPAQEEEKPTTSIQPPAPQPDIAPEPEPEPEEEPEPEPKPEPLPSDDEDEDGLTLAEETLFGTSDESTDSDKDGFTDLLEVVNLYNPSGFTPTRLDEADLVETHTDEEQGYGVLYPKSWTVTSEEGVVTFSDGEGESVVIEIKPNQEGQTLLDWFLNENPLVPTTHIEESTTKAGDAFLTTSDDPVSYVFGDGVIYAISLESEESTLKFLATYRMMVNSFVLTP